MNSSAPSGNVLSAGVSVLPATTAAALLTSGQISHLASLVIVFAGVWALSYVALSATTRFIQK